MTQRRLFIIFCVLGMASGCQQGPEPFSKLRRSLYKIYAVSKSPNFISPWLDGSASSSSGTGFYIGENRIMTNAHVVAQAKYLAVQRDGDDKKVPAFVQFVGHDADLAIITVAEEGYFQGVRTLGFDGLPELRSPVSTLGYPLGGEQLSITEGVVSRISYRHYSHSGVNQHLLIQVDAAINPGNSGGPVVQNGKVVGVAFQGHTQAENTGYVIPVPVIQRFLKDIEDGIYDGHPTDFMVTDMFSLNNAGTRRYFGADEERGVQVGFIPLFSPLHGHLEAQDILLSIDGFDIGVDGKVAYYGERVSFKVIYDLHQINDTVVFEVLRKGKKIKTAVKIRPADPHHNPTTFYGSRPKFLTFGGLVFTALTANYLQEWGNKWFANSPYILRFAHFYKPFIEELKHQSDIIVLSLTLPHPVNTYANDHRHNILTEVNGVQILNMEHLAEQLKMASGEFVRFNFFENRLPLVLPLEKAKSAQTQIEESYQVVPKAWFDGRDKDGAVTSL